MTAALFPLAPIQRPPNRHARERRVASREHHDFFPTPPEATVALLERERFPGGIWECACGDGAMAVPLAAAGYAVTCTDLVDRGCGRGGVDFIAARRLPPGVQSIVTNPPFKLATAFLQRALGLGAEKVAFFCRLAFLEGQERRPLHEEHLSRVWVFSSRITLWAGDAPKEGRVERGAIAYAWFVYERGQRGAAVGWIP